MKCRCCNRDMTEKLTKTLSDKKVYQCDCGHKEEELNDPILDLSAMGIEIEEE